MWVVWAIAWNVALVTLIIVDPHPSLDMKRCYVDRAAFTRVCWPRHGCFMSDYDTATCWQVGKLVGKRK